MLHMRDEAREDSGNPLMKGLENDVTEPKLCPKGPGEP